MNQANLDRVTQTLAEIKTEGMLESERMITFAQGGQITISDCSVINLCTNSSLGFAKPSRIDPRSQVSNGPQGLRYGVRSVHLRHPRHSPYAGRQDGGEIFETSYKMIALLESSLDVS